MDPYRAERLSALIWRERLKAAGPLIVIVVVIASILLGFTLHNAPSTTQQLEGDVTSWTRAQSSIGSGSYAIDVRLTSGARVVAAASDYGRAPRIGERITIDKITTLTGAVRYRWSRQ